MIGLFRRFINSPFALALLALVLLAFIVTGVRDPFGGGPTGSALAKVGSISVTDQEFARLWQRAMAQLQRTQPGLTPEQAARQGAVDQILQDDISGKALEAFASSQGVAAGTKLVDAEIASAPAFQLAGKFDQRTYEGVLQSQRMSDRQLRDGLRGDILRRQLLAPLGAYVSTPNGVAAPYARIILESRQGLIAAVPAEQAGAALAPTDAQLQAFYNAHKAAFTIPERRSFRYAVIDAAQLGAANPPTDAEIEAYYKAHADQYGAVERRHIAQAVLQDEAMARRLAAAAKGPLGFDAAAKQIAQLQTADTDVGDRTQAEFAGSSSPAVAQAAFALPQDGVSDPVRDDFGWHVLHVTTITRTAGTPLAAARPAIVAALETERGKAKLEDLSDQISKAAGKPGATFGDLARRFALQAQQTPPVTSGGIAVGAPPIDPTLKPLVQAAFQAEPSDAPSVEDLGQGKAALFQVAQVTPPTLPKLAEIAPQVRQAYLLDARATAARKLADAIVAEVKAGKSLAAVAAEHHLPAPQAIAAKRIQLLQAGARVPPPVAQLFSQPQGAVTAQSAGPGGAYVVQTLVVTPGDPASAPPIVQQIRRQFAQLSAEEMADQFARAAAAKVGVKRNEAAIAALRARLAGLDTQPH